MKNKTFKIITLMIISIMILTGCSNSSKSNNETSKQNDDILISMILDKGGINDQSFNQSSWEGAVKASESFGVNVKYFESSTDSDYSQNIETAVDMDSDLIICVGFNLSNAVKEAALNYPDQAFAIVDGSFDKIPNNVTPIVFNEYQAGYLVGLAAAKTVKSDNFAFIGGFKVPAVENYKNGFEKGLSEVNPNSKLHVQYANSFTDAGKGRVIAEQLIKNNNASCILSAAGGVNAGAYEACAENNKFAIAVDMSQSYIAPKTILTSAIKKVDVGVHNTIKDFIDGNLKGGVNKVYDISNNGVDYEKTNILSKETIEYIDNTKKSIIKQDLN